MTDRELLEDAAKVAGIDTTRCLQYADGAFDWPGKAGRWNPLADDGDALRLAVKLAIDFKIRNEATWWDLLAATRRAIVRAAAELGRSKE